MNTCRVCKDDKIECLYQADAKDSITSLATKATGPTRVSYCRSCAHLQSDEMGDLTQYYDDAYNINTASEEDDQLYGIVDGKPVFRNAYQAEAMLARLELSPGARTLDYGCGPAHTSRALSAQRPDLGIHLFDVSRNYLATWQRALPEASTACYEVPDNWYASFDVVLSFFALEHVAEPRQFARRLLALLRPGGQAYVVVPNVYMNVADFIVADHVNHFSRQSLQHLFLSAGFELESISDSDHSSAWTVVARRPTGKQSAAPVLEAQAALQARAGEMAAFWTGTRTRIQAYEASHPDLPYVIYGSGFYGSYIHTALQNPERVLCFVDRNPHQHSKLLHGLPICGPEALGLEQALIWVGLNPRVAQAAMAELSVWSSKSHLYFYI